MNEIVALSIPQKQDISKQISVCGKATPEEIFEQISEPKSLGDLVNIPLTVTGVFSSVIDVASDPNPETGEVKVERVPLLYIITEDGAIVSRSMTVIRSVMTFFTFFGPPDSWKAPKKVVFKQVRGKEGRTYYNLSLAK